MYGVSRKISSEPKWYLLTSEKFLSRHTYNGIKAYSVTDCQYRKPAIRATPTIRSAMTYPVFHPYGASPANLNDRNKSALGHEQQAMYLSWNVRQGAGEARKPSDDHQRTGNIELLDSLSPVHHRRL